MPQRYGAPPDGRARALRQCWQCGYESHWRKIDATCTTKFMEEAARHGAGTKAEIDGLLQGRQCGQFVTKCVVCLADELDINPPQASYMLAGTSLRRWRNCGRSPPALSSSNELWWARRYEHRCLIAPSSLLDTLLAPPLAPHASPIATPHC